MIADHILGRRPHHLALSSAMMKIYPEKHSPSIDVDHKGQWSKGVGRHGVSHMSRICPGHLQAAKDISG
jgi:hypothetical protein